MLLERSVLLDEIVLSMTDGTKEKDTWLITFTEVS